MDETSVKVDGVNYWLWVFTTTICTLFVVRKSRGKKVLVEVLGSGFGGFIGCDGHKAYGSFSDRLQRCWAHLLREAEALAKDYVETKEFYLGLRELFYDIDRCTKDGVPVWMGLGVREEAEKRLCVLLKGCRVRRKKAIGGLFRRFGEVFRIGLVLWWWRG